MSGPGPDSVIRRCRLNVRITPASGPQRLITACRMSAKTGCEQSQQSNPLFNHLVGALLKKPRHVDPQCLRSFHTQNEFEPRR